MHLRFEQPSQNILEQMSLFLWYLYEVYLFLVYLLTKETEYLDKISTANGKIE